MNVNRTNTRRRLWRSIFPCMLFYLMAMPQVRAQGAAPAPAPAPTPVPTPNLEIQDNPNLHMVAIEALVVEVDEERTRDLGIEYGINQTGGNDGLGIINGGNVSLGNTFMPVKVPVLVTGTGGQNSISYDNSRLPGLGISLSGMNIGSGVVSAKLRALLNKGDATIRTRPIAVALNKTMVNIEAVTQVPYMNAELNPIYGSKLQVAYEKIGVKMKVTPSIVGLRPGVVQLNVDNLELSVISNYITQDNIDRPTFTTNSTKTAVTLREGETFVISGFKTRRFEHSENRVPLLGDIPLLGLAFRSQSDVEKQMDALFFITPYIITPGENIILPHDFKNKQMLGVDAKVEVAKR